MENERQLISVKQAAEILNRSPSTIYKAIHTGRLHYADTMRRLLDRTSLKQEFAKNTRPRIDKPIPSAKAMKQEPSDKDEWQTIVSIANELIDPEAWKTPPPWTADRWAGLAGVLDIAQAEVSAACTPKN